MTELRPLCSDLFATIWQRQSVRAYRPDPVPESILARIMEAGRQAPSGGNGQGWRFGVITDPALRQELAAAAGDQDFVAQAPVVIACCARLYDPAEESDFSRDVNRLRWGVPLDEVVAGSAHPEAVRMLVSNATPLVPGAHIQLAAAAYGLGTCWIGYLDVARAGRALKLPDSWRCHFLMALGYPAETPERRPRKPLSDITFGDAWTEAWAPAAASPGLLGDNAAPDQAPAAPAGANQVTCLSDIVNRAKAPAPWSEADNIPWNEPGFSRRMLEEHLSQEHDAASRRTMIIDDHVDWLHTRILGGKPGRVLDLGCGPGLYSNRLARLGHQCTGIDFSPASIEYARNTAAAEGLSAEFRLTDLREAQFGTGYDLVMFIFGEPNVFPTAQLRDVLRRAYDALVYGGKLVLEVSTWDGLKGDAPNGERRYWYTSQHGLFADRPHIVLTSNRWDEATHTKTDRHYVIDAATGAVERCGNSLQAYTFDEYRALLAGAGFVGIQKLEGMGNYVQSGLICLTAVKPQWAEPLDKQAAANVPQA